MIGLLVVIPGAMPVDVVLNVYDLMDQTPICCGLFHTGVEILGVEYSFAQGAGVYECAPRSAPDAKFREALVLGSVASTQVARAALDRLRPDFPGSAYSLIFRNCNDFSNAYVKALLGRDIPGHINRLARLGRAWPIRCFLPPRLQANGGGADSAGVSLLANAHTPAPAVPLFQGPGMSMSAGSSAATPAGTGGILARVRRFFGFGGGGPTRDANNVVLHSQGEARELRAAAAARRLAGDIEEGQ